MARRAPVGLTTTARRGGTGSILVRARSASRTTRTMACRTRGRAERWAVDEQSAYSEETQVHAQARRRDAQDRPRVQSRPPGPQARRAPEKERGQVPDGPDVRAPVAHPVER